MSCSIWKGGLITTLNSSFFSVLRTLQCTPKELAILLKAFERIATSFEAFGESKDVGFRSPILNDIVFSFPVLATPLKDILETFDLEKAAKRVREELWRDNTKYPGIADAKFVCLLSLTFSLACTQTLW